MKWIITAYSHKTDGILMVVNASSRGEAFTDFARRCGMKYVSGEYLGQLNHPVNVARSIEPMDDYEDQTELPEDIMVDKSMTDEKLVEALPLITQGEWRGFYLYIAEYAENISLDSAVCW